MTKIDYATLLNKAATAISQYAGSVYEQNHGKAGGERVGRLSPALLRATATSATQRWSWQGADGGRSGNADAAAAATSASALAATSANGAAWCPCAGEGTCKTGAESWRAPPCTCLGYRSCATATAPVHDQCSPTIAPVISSRARALTTSKGRQLGVTNARGAAGPAGCTTAPCCTAASRCVRPGCTHALPRINQIQPRSQRRCQKLF